MRCGGVPTRARRHPQHRQVQGRLAGAAGDSIAEAARLGLDTASLFSEFGASDDTADLARVTADANLDRIGWIYGSYKSWGDPTTQAQGSGAQGLFADDSDLRHVKLAKLEVLGQPFPQAVAGTPERIAWRPNAAYLLIAAQPGVHIVTVRITARLRRAAALSD